MNTIFIITPQGDKTPIACTPEALPFVTMAFGATDIKSWAEVAEEGEEFVVKTGETVIATIHRSQLLTLENPPCKQSNHSEPPKEKEPTLEEQPAVLESGNEQPKEASKEKPEGPKVEVLRNSSRPEVTSSPAPAAPKLIRTEEPDDPEAKWTMVRKKPQRIQ